MGESSRSMWEREGTVDTCGREGGSSRSMWEREGAVGTCGREVENGRCMLNGIWSTCRSSDHQGALR